MSSLARFFRRLRNAIAPGRAEDDLAREINAHLALIEDEHRRRGWSPEDARLAAHRALGGAEVAKDRHRDARSFVWLDDLRRDVAVAWRDVRRSPVFGVVAVLILALAIGATTAIFTVVDHVLIRSLPVPNADRLVRLYESNRSSGTRSEASPPNVVDWRRDAKTLDRIMMIGGTSVTMTGASEPETVIGMLIGPEYFELTGVKPALGRPFDREEYASIANAALGAVAVREQPVGPASLIISDALWRRQFGADPGVVGREVSLNGERAIVRGVMPPTMHF